MIMEPQRLDDLLADSLQLEYQLRQDDKQELFCSGDLSSLVQQFCRAFQSLTKATQFRLFCYSSLHIGQLERYLSQHQEEDSYV